MGDFITDSVLQVMDMIRAENTVSIKIMMFTEAIEDDGFLLMATMMARGIVTKKPRVSYNQHVSGDDLGDVIRYLNGEYEKIPQNTLRLLSYMYNPGLIGLNRGQILMILQDIDTPDVYDLIAEGHLAGCIMCGDKVVNEVICDYCIHTLHQFPKYRSTDFAVILTKNNYQRIGLLQKVDFDYAIQGYDVTIRGNSINYVRTAPIMDARLPIEEYQTPLS